MSPAAIASRNDDRAGASSMVLSSWDWSASGACTTCCEPLSRCNTDQTAHDVFRAFRKSFEERNAGFERLVIFGQHGVSEAVNALLAEFGLTAGSLPALVLVIAPGNSRKYYLNLHPGEARSDDPGRTASPAAELLSQVEKLVDGADDETYLAGISGLTKLQVSDEDLASMVARLIENQDRP